MTPEIPPIAQATPAGAGVRSIGPIAAAILLCAVVVLSGCTTSPQMVPEGGADDAWHRPSALLDHIETFEATADDGVALRGHVYIPTGDGPWATILTYSPYWNEGGPIRSDEYWSSTEDGGRTMGPTTILGSYAPFLEAGFAVALVNIRGTGISDGCFSYVDPADGPDANAVIEEIAAQPWSDGNVGMIGISYNGWTSYAAMASDPHPALKAIVPVSGTIDHWNLLGRNGAASLLAPAHPANRDLHQGLGVSGMRAYPVGSSLPTPDHVCAETAYKALSYQDLTVTGDKTPFFEQRDLRDRLSGSDVAVYTTNGLGTGEGHILQIEGLWDNLSGDRRLEIGQWGHHWPNEDPDAFSEKIVGWFDQHLRGAPELFESDVVLFQDDSLEWHQTTSWPPPGSTTRLWMVGGQLMPTGGSAAYQAQTFQSVPTDPGLTFPGCDAVQAMYVSPSLKDDVLLAGNFVVNASLSATEPNGNLAAFLFQTSGVGTCGDGRASEIGRALSDLRHRGHLEAGRDFPVGAPGDVSLKSHPYASFVPAGNRIVLALGGGSVDLFPKAMAPVITVHEGVSGVGTIEFTVVEGTLEFEG